MQIPQGRCVREGPSLKAPLKRNAGKNNTGTSTRELQEGDSCSERPHVSTGGVKRGSGSTQRAGRKKLREKPVEGRDRVFEKKQEGEGPLVPHKESHLCGRHRSKFKKHLCKGLISYENHDCRKKEGNNNT